MLSLIILLRSDNENLRERRHCSKFLPSRSEWREVADSSSGGEESTLSNNTILLKTKSTSLVVPLTALNKA
jgi:hypothetical protein